MDPPSGVGSGSGDPGNNGPDKRDEEGKTSSAETIPQQEDELPDPGVNPGARVHALAPR